MASEKKKKKKAGPASGLWVGSGAAPIKTGDGERSPPPIKTGDPLNPDTQNAAESRDRRCSFIFVRTRLAQILYFKASTMTSAAEPIGSAPAPWYAQYPAPQRTAAAVSRADVLQMLRDEGT